MKLLVAVTVFILQLMRFIERGGRKETRKEGMCWQWDVGHHCTWLTSTIVGSICQCF